MKPSRSECCPACGQKDRLTVVVNCATDEEEFIECEACNATFREVTVLVPYERRERDKPRDYLLDRVNRLEQQMAVVTIRTNRLK